MRYIERGQRMERAIVHLPGADMEGYVGEYVFETLRKSSDFYEAATLQKWTPILRETETVFDIGANLGNHCVYWALHLRPKKIYAFEPLEENFALLQSNAARSAPEIIEPQRMALGDHQGTVTVSCQQEGNLGGTSFAYSQERAADGVPAATADAFAAEHHIEKVDFVKIDTEGFELHVLQGMEHLLRRDKPAVWVEVGCATYREVMRLLRESGYLLSDIEGFNLLFLHPSRYPQASSYDPDKVLEAMFRYHEKTDAYYANYLKAKGWLDERNRSLEASKAQVQSKTEELKACQSECRQAQERRREEQDARVRLQEAYDRQERELACARETCELYALELAKHADGYEEEAQLLEELKKTVLRLQTQNSYLKRENEEYRRKLSRITDTWYGRFAIRCYRLLQQLRRKMKSTKK